MAGRPPKFKSESVFTEYLLDNSHFWVKDFFGEEIKSIKVNSPIERRGFGKNTPRIDFDIISLSGKRIGIEVKNPSQPFHEVSRSVSQLLAYAVLAEESGAPFDELSLIISHETDIAFRIIKKFNLPIRVFYVDRHVHGEML